MDVGADGGHWSSPGSAGWMRGVTSVTATRDWLAATSSDGIKDAVGWRGGKGDNRGTREEKARRRRIVGTY
jgi:hypothetical protein